MTTFANRKIHVTYFLGVPPNGLREPPYAGRSLSD